MAVLINTTKDVIFSWEQLNLIMWLLLKIFFFLLIVRLILNEEPNIKHIRNCIKVSW